MAMKTILAPLLGRDGDAAVLAAAYAMAAPRNGRVHALYLHRDPKDVLVSQISEGMSAGMIESVMASAEKHVEEARSKARGVFDTWAAENNVKVDVRDPNAVTADFEEVSGDVAQTLMRRARVCDLTCVVRPGENAAGDEDILLDTSIMETGRPVLMVPASKKMPGGKTVAVAWNGSKEAARAVAVTQTVLDDADKIVVLTGHDGPIGTDDGADDIADALKRRGPDAVVENFDARDGNVAGRLQAEAARCGADLLIVGAYSHSRLREYFLGGVTDDLVSAARMPILMAH